MRKFYPVDDMLSMIGQRMAKGELCIIPVREDMPLTDGTIVPAMGAWGHSDPYKLIQHEGKTYGVTSWDDVEYELSDLPDGHYAKGE
jgi:hypothetical protein